MKLLAMLLVVTIGVILLINMSSIKFDEDLMGRQGKVEWSTLNLRSEAGTNERIIGMLHEGDVVRMTGNKVSFLDGYYENWIEVEASINGIPVTGWVCTDGIDFHGKAG